MSGVIDGEWTPGRSPLSGEHFESYLLKDSWAGRGWLNEGQPADDSLKFSLSAPDFSQVIDVLSDAAAANGLDFTWALQPLDKFVSKDTPARPATEKHDYNTIVGSRGDRSGSYSGDPYSPFASRWPPQEAFASFGSGFGSSHHESPRGAFQGPKQTRYALVSDVLRRVGREVPDDAESHVIQTRSFCDLTNQDGRECDIFGRTMSLDGTTDFIKPHEERSAWSPRENVSRPYLGIVGLPEDARKAFSPQISGLRSHPESMAPTSLPSKFHTASCGRFSDPKVSDAKLSDPKFSEAASNAKFSDPKFSDANSPKRSLDVKTRPGSSGRLYDPHSNFQELSSLISARAKGQSLNKWHQSLSSPLFPVPPTSPRNSKSPPLRPSSRPLDPKIPEEGDDREEDDQPKPEDQFYKTKLCVPFFLGKCRRGKFCCFAHGQKELRTSLNLKKTKLCDAWQQHKCQANACPFAHGENELRATADYFKTGLCKYWKRGLTCEAGGECRHAHGIEELRPRRRLRRPDRDKRARTISTESADGSSLPTGRISEAPNTLNPSSLERPGIQSPRRQSFVFIDSYQSGLDSPPMPVGHSVSHPVLFSLPDSASDPWGPDITMIAKRAAVPDREEGILSSPEQADFSPAEPPVHIVTSRNPAFNPALGVTVFIDSNPVQCNIFLATPKNHYSDSISTVDGCIPSPF